MAAHSHQSGWVQPTVLRGTIAGTVTQIDMICNKVRYTGPISANVPIGRPQLAPVYAAYHPL